MSSIYPSLEDMQVDKMMQAQVNEFVGLSASQYPNLNATQPGSYDVKSVTVTENTELYPALSNYMGLELTEDMIAANMPEYLQRTTTQIQTYSAVS